MAAQLKPEPNAKLWAELRRQGLKQKDFAIRIGVDNPTVSRVVCGILNLDYDEKKRWARALGKEIEEIF